MSTEEAPPQRRLNPFAGGASPVIAQEPPQESDANIARLQELARKGEKVDTLESELVAVRRDLAIARTGIDTEDPLGKLFLRGYDGDLTDVESVKAAAAQLGVPLRRPE